MIFDISDNYRVQIGRMNFVLEQKRTRKDRETGEAKQAWVPLGYYSGLSSAIEALPDHVLLTEEFASLEAATKRLEALGKELAGRMRK